MSAFNLESATISNPTFGLAMISFLFMASLGESLLTRWAGLSPGLLEVQNPSSLELSMVAIVVIAGFKFLRRDRHPITESSAPLRATPDSDCEQRPPAKRAA